MRINSVTNTMPMAVRNKMQQNNLNDSSLKTQANSQNPNFSGEIEKVATSGKLRNILSEMIVWGLALVGVSAMWYYDCVSGTHKDVNLPSILEADKNNTVKVLDNELDKISTPNVEINGEKPIKFLNFEEQDGKFIAKYYKNGENCSLEISKIANMEDGNGKTFKMKFMKEDKIDSIKEGSVKQAGKDIVMKLDDNEYKITKFGNEIIAVDNTNGTIYKLPFNENIDLSSLFVKLCAMGLCIIVLKDKKVVKELKLENENLREENGNMRKVVDLMVLSDVLGNLKAEMSEESDAPAPDIIDVDPTESEEQSKDEDA